MKSRWILWFIVLVTIISLVIDLPLPSFRILNRNFKINFPLKLGLDLQGGTELVLLAKIDNIDPKDRDDALESAKAVIERRVNFSGVSEALVQTSKIGEERRILAQLPGIDASKAAELVGETALLEFREIPATLSAQEVEATKSGLPFIFLAKETGLTGADIKKAQVTFGTSRQIRSGPQIAIEFTDDGSKKFAEITKRNIGRPLCIFLDGQPIKDGCPTVQQEIIGGNAVITGQFTLEAAKQLAIDLNAGALKVPLTRLSSSTIPPSLGQVSVHKSIVAGIIGFLVITIFMGIYYGILGLIADLALLIYTLLVLAIFKTGLFLLPPITLTLAGIAGFVLSIGMAVDANILIFERMKEEIRWGKSKTLALDLGFKRAWSSIWASNVSSLITAFILYSMGQSIVRGFAVTLAIGVLVSMFTAVLVTRTFLRMIIK